MRLKFKGAGMSFSAFPPHEVVEMLLYFSHKRRNTNPLAHNLCDRFGDVGGVINAGHKELSEIHGVGGETAARFAFLSELFKYCRK